MDSTPLLLLFIIFVICSAEDTPKNRKGRRMSRRNISCDYNKNKYYEPQINRCLRCDKCIVGKGQVNRNEFDLKFDLKHGALNCLPCRPCPDTTFNKARAYTCKQCRNCTQLGLVELKPCSTSSNAVCGDAIPKPVTQSTTDQTGQTIASLTNKESLKNRGISNFPTGPVPTSALFAVIGVLVVTALSGTSFVYYKHKHKNEMNVLPDGSIETANVDEDKHIAEKESFLPLNNTAKAEGYVIELPERAHDTHETTPKTTSTQWVTHLEENTSLTSTTQTRKQSNDKYVCLNGMYCKHSVTNEIDYNVNMKDVSPLSSTLCTQCSKFNHQESLNAMSDFQYELHTVAPNCFHKEAYV